MSSPSDPATKKLSFFGLGAMGGGMAAHLARSGYHVTGYDLYTPLVDTLVSTGGHAAPTPAEAASSAPVALIMVATMYQADALLFEGSHPALPSLPESALLILHSTCPPSYPPALRARLDASGRPDVRLLDCPVSGGTIRAGNGTLSIFASGPESDLAAAEPILNTLSANLYTIPGGLSAGQKTKAIHQLLAATNIISASEALGLATYAGLDTQAVFDTVSAGRGASFMFANRGPHMLAADWSVLSAVAIIWKDAGIVVDAARDAKCPVPLATAAEQLYSMGNSRGLLREDDAKLVSMYLPKADAGAVAKLKGNGTKEGKGGVTAETVADLLAGIHLAASVEAMYFCKALEVDRRVMAEIVSKAAGWCAMFTEHVPAMLVGDEWTLARCKGTDVVRRKLEAAVDTCRAIGFPCQMGVTALNQYYFAGLA
ncbi:hypothetical protein K461DRAFT_253198 [Myriangium duriaei CBS 260.36]|uniref:3-hydroxyisobutyrate dehydrogenase n=1 Tax=Myriangium duriaei CBS 260.36 TaxID=1168546 RepID=A0A9P4MJ81_9PEZI|nr:hypothetical protein K461DRAFT_253198 [Myriangium duriaei CBS 260.36]